MLNRIKFYKISNILAIVAAVGTIIASILTIVSFFRSDKISLISFIVAFLVMSAYATYRFLKLNDVNRQRFLEFSRYSHSMNHDIRNFIFNIDKKFKNSELTKNGLISEVKIINQNILNYLVEILETASNQKIFANIKWFVPEKDIDLLFTLCRSSNTPKNRMQYKTFKISDYCGLEQIYYHSCDDFYAPNLKKAQDIIEKENNGHTYKRSNEYSGSIVVPIRIKKDYVEDTRNDLIQGYIYNSRDKEYFCLGFLCIDSPSIAAFRKNEKDQYVELVKSFSNCLYQVYEKFHYMYDQIPLKTVVQ